MQTLTIDWSTEQTTSTGKTYKKVSYSTESGVKGEASVWSDAPFYAQVAPGATIEADIKQTPDGKYTNLIGAKIARTMPSTFQKSAQIDKAMDKKADQIAKAQDRSAWMWAKTNAATLLANNPIVRKMGPQGIADEVVELATKIYNAEPNSPF